MANEVLALIKYKDGRIQVMVDNGGPLPVLKKASPIFFNNYKRRYGSKKEESGNETILVAQIPKK